MLDLGSPRWTELGHAYGDAADVPEMLSDLATFPSGDVSDDVWEPLWSAICHQGTVYTASYAVVPHLVSFAERMIPHDQLPYWALVGAIAGSFEAAPVPDDLRADYEAALDRSEPLIRAALAAPGRDEAEAIHLLAAVAAVRGHRDVAYSLEGFADGEFRPTCPGCEAELFVTVHGEKLIVAAEDPVTDKPARATAVVRSQARPATVDPGVPRWDADCISEHLVALALGARQARLAKLIRAWEGTVTCPACDVDLQREDVAAGGAELALGRGERLR